MTDEQQAAIGGQRAPNGVKRLRSPFSRRIIAKIINGHTHEGRFIRSYQRELIEHIGGSPNIVQQRLIERAAMIALHLLRYDQQAHKEGGLSTRTTREYLALDGRLAKTLAQIGVKFTAPAAPKLKPKRAAPKKAPEPKPVVQKSDARSPSIAEALAAGKASPP